MGSINSIKTLSTGALVSIYNERNEIIMIAPVDAANNTNLTVGGVKFNRSTGFKIANQFSKGAATFIPVTTRQNPKPVSLRLAAVRIEAFDTDQLGTVDTEEKLFVNRAKNCKGTMYAIKLAVDKRIAEDGLQGRTPTNLKVLKNSISFDIITSRAETPEEYLERVHRAPKLARLERAKSNAASRAANDTAKKAA